MAGQSEMALVNSDDQEKATKRKKTRSKRSTAAKKTSSAARKKPASSLKAKLAESDGLPIMKLRAIDIVDGSGEKASGPSKAKDQDNEQPQVIHMPPPATRAPDLSDTAASAPANSASANNENQTDENQVTDPELLELLEQLSVTIDTANNVLEAAANVPTDAPQPQPQEMSEQIAPEREMAAQTQGPHGSDHHFDRLVGIHAEKDDLRPLAERFASTPASDDAGKSKRGKFRLIANAALTGLVIAAGVGWLAYTNPWILESGDETAAISPVPAPQQVAVAEPEDPKDQAQLADDRAPIQKPETRTSDVAAAPAIPKPKLSALTPPADDPAPMEDAAKAPSAEIVPLEPVRGLAGEKIALGIEVPADAAGAEMSVMIQSVPEKAKLSIGKNLGSGNWLLTTEQLNGLTLNTQDDLAPGDYQVEVIMVRSDGKVPEARKIAVVVGAAPTPVKASVQAAPAKKAVKAEPATEGKRENAAKPDVAVRVEKEPAPALIPAVAPTAAPASTSEPKAQPAPVLPSLSPAEVNSILRRGDALLREGDVAGARLLLGYAASRGNKDAMIKLAKSYDPEFLAKLGVRGVQPDPEKAAHWYGRAEKTAAAQ